MGWLFFPKPSGSPAEIIASRALRWSSLSAAAQPQIVKSVTTARAVFYAMRFPAAFYAETANGKTPKGFTPAADGSVTVALVILYKREGGEFGYKDMDETMGPNETAPSEAFLSVLSPVDETAEWAFAWRKRSRDEIRRASAGRQLRAQITDGVKIRLDKPLNYSGDMIDTFVATTLMRRGRKQLVFTSPGKAGLYRVPATALYTAAIVEG